MGNDYYSASLRLVNQMDPICITEPRFVLQHPMALIVEEKYNSCFSWAYFEAKCAQTGAEYFTIKEKTFSNTKIIRDSCNLPIWNLKDKKGFSGSYKLFLGDRSDREICRISSDSESKAKLTVKFQDELSGRLRHVVLKGDRQNQQAVIYLDDPTQAEGGIPIANIKREASLERFTEYYLEISPGVDITLVVIMCIALHLDIHNMKAGQRIGGLPMQ